MNQNEILAHIEQEIRKRLGDHLKKIILFGSRARGDHEPDSDYDLLVILDEISPSVKDAVYEVGGEFLYEHNIVLSLLPIIENTINERYYEPFLINAFKEGIVCYEYK